MNDNNKLAALLRSALGPIDGGTAEAFAEAMSEVPLDPPPSGSYVCGCPWDGAIIPHYCPKHHQPPVFVIQEPRK